MTHVAPQIVVAPPGPGTPGAADDIRGVKPPVAIPSVWTWLGPVLVGLAAAVLVAWLFRVWRRRRRQGQTAPVIVVPAHVRARERLRAALALVGQPKPFCIVISNALRVYLEERFDLRAPERTTEEFLDELQRSPRLARQQKDTLGDFLTRCDLVKFARHEPDESSLRELLDAAMRLVEETADQGAEGPGGELKVSGAEVGR